MINNTIADNTGNLITKYAPNYISNISDFLLLSGFLFILILFIIKWFTDTGNGISIIISAIPAIALDLMYSYGSYTFVLPLMEYTVTKGVLTLHFLDYILNFGLFLDYGISTFNQVSGAYTLSSIQMLLVYLLTFGDSIIEFIALTYIVYYITKDLNSSIMLSAAVVLIYSYAVNSMKELATMTNSVSSVFYFFDNAAQSQLITVLGAFLVSFFIIIFLLSTIINLFVGITKSTIMPTAETWQWTQNFSGLAFIMTIAYSTLILLHPTYTWYVVLPLFVLYGIVKNRLNGYADGIKAHDERVSDIREALNYSNNNDENRRY